jgi:hypothetical protein
MADAGKLLPTDFLWKEGMGGWVPANSVRGLLAWGRADPPLLPPPTAVSAVRCPHCQALLRVEDRHVSRIIACPTCKGQIRVPCGAERDQRAEERRQSDWEELRKRIIAWGVLLAVVGLLVALPFIFFTAEVFSALGGFLWLGFGLAILAGLVWIGRGGGGRRIIGWGVLLAVVGLLVALPFIFFTAEEVFSALREFLRFLLGLACVLTCLVWIGRGGGGGGGGPVYVRAHWRRRPRR